MQGLVNIYREFEKRWEELFQILNGKKIIIWGYGSQGKLIESYCKQNLRKIEAIIDSNFTYEGKIYLAPYLLKKYNPNVTVILVAVSGNIENILEQAFQYGYSLEKNIIVFRDFFVGCNDVLVDYYSWAEKKIKGVNFEKRISKEELGYEDKNYNLYSFMRGIDLRKVLSQFCFSNEDAVFDYGCGRGAALSLFSHLGIRKLGGIELSDELYISAKSNLEKMNINADIVLGDAILHKQIDDYNFFYIFDSFRENVFRTVIGNIYESYLRKKRKVCLIYSMPYEHDIVMESGKFELIDIIEGFGGILQSTNIYVISE